MKVSDIIRSGSGERRAAHRDPKKVGEALKKGAEALYNVRGQNGGFRDAWSWLGDMLNDATGLSGDGFYQDKDLKKLKDMMSKLDGDIGQVAAYMESAYRKRFKNYKPKSGPR